MDDLLTKRDFHYTIPEDQVAQHPAARRQDSRLLVYEKGNISSSQSSQIADHIEEGAVFVRNNSRVIPSRLIGQTQFGGKLELFLIEPLDSGASVHWKALGRPLKKMRPGTHFKVAGKNVEVLDQATDEDTPFITVAIEGDWPSFYTWIDQVGHIPLPPYIRRDHKSENQEVEDRERYQTVYSRELGSVAAPTAGLHFTEESIQRLETEKSVEFIDITLHVGAGTFLPVKSDEIHKHKMHEERYYIPDDSYRKIIDAQQSGRKIYAVGTTSLRCLESFFLSGQAQENWAELTDQWHRTDLFIYPKKKADRYRPAFLSGIMTNFHQPESTLMMLISSLVGYDELMKIYSYAIENRFRFYSYGDSSLLKFNH